MSYDLEDSLETITMEVLEMHFWIQLEANVNETLVSDLLNVYKYFSNDSYAIEQMEKAYDAKYGEVL
jgi:hypothetical protein